MFEQHDEDAEELQKQQEQEEDDDKEEQQDGFLQLGKEEELDTEF